MTDIKKAALELCIDLERRGSLEGHYIWFFMVEKAFSQIRRDALNEAANLVEDESVILFDPYEFRETVVQKIRNLVKKETA